MIPYVLLLVVPLLFSLVALASSVRENGKKWTLAVGNTEKVRDHNLILPVFFVILIVILSLRDISIGNDTENYQRYFQAYQNLGFFQIFQMQGEHLFWLLMWIVTCLTDSFQIFLTIAALITVLPIAILYSKDRRGGFLKIVLFMNMSTFIMLFSGLRQAIAISIGLLAYEYVKEKQLFRFLLMALIAVGFHTSAIMIFLFYPLYHATFKKKHLWFVIPAILLVYVFNGPLFVMGGNLLERMFGDQYALSATNTGAYTMLILFALFAVMAYVLPDEKRMDQETLGLRNFLLAAVVFQCFAPLHPLSMRMNYYFIIFIPELIPRLLHVPKTSMKKVAPVVNIVLIGFFALYYLLTTYQSCRTGISALNTYPYVPFWK